MDVTLKTETLQLPLARPVWVLVNADQNQENVSSSPRPVTELDRAVRQRPNTDFSTVPVSSLRFLFDR